MLRVLRQQETALSLGWGPMDWQALGTLTPEQSTYRGRVKRRDFHHTEKTMEALLQIRDVLCQKKKIPKGQWDWAKKNKELKKQNKDINGKNRNYLSIWNLSDLSHSFGRCYPGKPMAWEVSQQSIFWCNWQWKPMNYFSAIAIGEGLSLFDFKVTGETGLFLWFIGQANRKRNS